MTNSPARNSLSQPHLHGMARRTLLAAAGAAALAPVLAWAQGPDKPLRLVLQSRILDPAVAADHPAGDLTSRTGRVRPRSIWTLNLRARRHMVVRDAAARGARQAVGVLPVVDRLRAANCARGVRHPTGKFIAR